MLGPPGAGKGTQAERLARLRRVPEDFDRGHPARSRADGHQVGCIARATMAAGNLVGDDVMIGIVTERLERDDARHGFVLDGFPRTVVQASALDRMVDGRGPLIVLDIVVPEDVAGPPARDAPDLQRLRQQRVARVGRQRCGSCGGQLVVRADDGDAIVRERLKVYQRQTKPLVDYYRPAARFGRSTAIRRPTW